MSKQLQMWLARPVGRDSRGLEFRWGAYVAADPVGAALAAVKWRKEKGGLEFRPAYEVVPMRLQEGHVDGYQLRPNRDLATGSTAGALWDWEKLVEVRV